MRERQPVLWTAVVALLVTTGCGSLMHPQAAEFVQQAKGSSGIETQINLTTMIESSVQSLRGQEDYRVGFDRLHNQLYALKTTACDVTSEQAKSPAYVEAATLRREVGVIFYRLWKVRDEQTLRDRHLNLLGARIKDLREALQAVKG